MTMTTANSGSEVSAELFLSRKRRMLFSPLSFHCEGTNLGQVREISKNKKNLTLGLFKAYKRI